MKSRTMRSLNTQVWSRSFYFAIILALLLFIPAGTIRYWQAWGYLMLFFGASSGITIYLMKKDPALLMRRMHAGPRAEKSKTQKIIMLCAMASFVAIFLVSALDYRFTWSPAPFAAIIVGYIAVALGFAMIFFVVKENTFASATIEVSKDQKVISKGLYAIVRHPMYTGGVLIILGTPFALGSLSGVVVAVIGITWIIWRLLDEEAFLSVNLPGYDEYRHKVRNRLVPYIW
jgi:protein-S-isoprenylcysteine O-methyltransferase Ste14